MIAEIHPYLADTSKWQLRITNNSFCTTKLQFVINSYKSEISELFQPPPLCLFSFKTKCNKSYLAFQTMKICLLKIFFKHLWKNENHLHTIRMELDLEGGDRAQRSGIVYHSTIEYWRFFFCSVWYNRVYTVWSSHLSTVSYSCRPVHIMPRSSKRWAGRTSGRQIDHIHLSFPSRKTFTISKWHRIDDIFEKFSSCFSTCRRHVYTDSLSLSHSLSHKHFRY